MKNKSKDLRKTQKRTMIVFAALAVLIVVISLLLYASKNRRKRTAVKPVEVVSPNTNIMKQKWLIKSQAQLERQTQQISMLQSKLKQLSRENRLLQKEIRKGQRPASASPSGRSRHYSYNPVNYPPPPNIPPSPYSYRSRHANYSSGSRSRPFPYGSSSKKTKHNQNSYQITQRPLDNLIAVAVPISYSRQNHTNKHINNHTAGAPNQTPLNQTAAVSGSRKPNRQRSRLLIPPGSFVSAFLLTGADVPTMGNGAVGPIPVVFRVMSLAQLPNYFRANIKSCFLLGQATGSLSAERAYIRVSTLSCIRKDGTPLVVHVRGYATGADGKAGLNGRVVSKQGAVLARALISGFLQGVGEAFSQTQTTISVSPLGSTNSVAPNTGTIVRYGVGTGVGKATEMLAKFYMKMANQMFPVIEINAGRIADIIFLSGVKLSGGGR